MLRRVLKLFACWVSAWLISFGDYIYRSAHFQAILLRQRHRPVDFEFIFRMVSVYGTMTLNFAWPSLLLLMPLYFWRRGHWLSAYWMIWTPLAAALCGGVAYFLLSGSAHNSISPTYRRIFVPRAIVSGAVTFLLAYLCLRWRGRTNASNHAVERTADRSASTL